MAGDPGGTTPDPREPRSLRDEVNKQDAFDSLRQEAYLNLARTRAILEGEFHALFKKHGLTEASYNVLRIVGGHDRKGTPIRSTAIRGDMVVRVPDVTRLVDRLEARELVLRDRCPADKRVVFVRITDAGRALLDTLHDAVLRTHESQMGHLSPDQLRTLNDLLYLARHPDDASGDQNP